MASAAVLLAGALLAASVSSARPPPSQSATACSGGGSGRGPRQGLGRGARSALPEGPGSRGGRSPSREGLRRERSSPLAKVLDLGGGRTDGPPRGLLSTPVRSSSRAPPMAVLVSSPARPPPPAAAAAAAPDRPAAVFPPCAGSPFSHVPRPQAYRVLGAVHRAPGGLTSLAGAAHLAKTSNGSWHRGPDSVASAVAFLPWPPPPGGQKNLSAFPPDANLGLVELFYVFCRPNRLHASMFVARPMVVARPSRFTLRDTSQKVVRLMHNSLVASLQTSNQPPAEISVVPNPYLDAGAFPIIMGVGNGMLCLCSEMAARPVLRLENRHIMDVYKDGSAVAKRFTFVCTFSGPTQRFESAAFPGWFLSTSQQSNQPLQLTNRLGATEITDFYFKKV